MNAITEKQKAVLRMINNHINKYGYPPTRKEISDYMGWASPNAAQEHLEALEVKGYLKLRPSVSRGIVIQAPKSKK